jgi:hypothetical protein
MNPIIEATSGEFQRLADIVVFQLRVFPFQIDSLRVQSNCLDDSAHCQAHSANTGPPIRMGRVDGDPIELAGSHLDSCR